MVLVATGERVALPLAPQVVALTPLGLFHDLRWLYVFHRTWLEFALGLAAIVVARAALTVAMARLAWPVDVAPPPWRRAFGAAIGFNLLGVVLLAPITTLLFGIAVVPFSWPYLAAVPALFLVSLVLSHGGVVRPWWRALPTRGAVGWFAADFLFLSAVSVALVALPAAAGVVVAGLAGGLQGWAWLGLTGSLARHRWPRWPVPVAPVTAAALLLVAVAGARIGFVVARVPPVIGSSVAPAPGPGARPVLVVAGFGSTCCTHADPWARESPDLYLEQFSYRGLGPGDRPLPHGSAATNEPLPLLADRMARQVDAMAAATGQRVSLVAESEGSLVTYAYLARYGVARLDAVVLLSPIVEPGRVTYPVPGKEGRGLAAGWQLRALVHVIGAMSPFGVSSERPLIASIDAEGARYAAAAACRTGVRRLTVVPLADAVTLPVPRFPPSVVIVGGFHGGLSGQPAVRHRVDDFLVTGRTTQPRLWAGLAQVLSGASAAWRVPSVPVRAPVCANTS